MPKQQSMIVPTSLQLILMTNNSMLSLLAEDVKHLHPILSGSEILSYLLSYMQGNNVVITFISILFCSSVYFMLLI